MTLKSHVLKAKSVRSASDLTIHPVDIRLRDAAV